MTTGRINQVTMLSERRNAAVHAGTHAQLDYALDGDLGSCTQPWKGSRYTIYRPPQNVVAFEFQNHTSCKQLRRRDDRISGGRFSVLPSAAGIRFL